MSTPTPADPFGQRPDPTSFADAMETMIDARIERRLRGRAGDRFQGVTDMMLVQELLARGWAVFRPNSQDK